MKTKLSRKPTNPYQDLPTVTAKETFLTETTTIRRGEKRAGNDPVVARHHGAFLAGDLQEHELPNPWDALIVDPPDHPPHVHIPPSIPPHRQVESVVNVWFEGGFAPGTPGAKSARPSGLVARSARPDLRRTPARSSGASRVVRLGQASGDARRPRPARTARGARRGVTLLRPASTVARPLVVAAARGTEREHDSSKGKGGTPTTGIRPSTTLGQTFAHTHATAGASRSPRTRR